MVYSVVFFGSDYFSLAHLIFITSEDGPLRDICHVRLVISGSTETPVAKHCIEVGLPYLTWPRRCKPTSAVANGIVKSIKALSTQLGDESSRLLGIVVSFGRYLPRILIKTLPAGVINVHPSLLPRWHGAAPLFHTLLAGDTVSGVSIILIPSVLPKDSQQRTFDVGPILLQRAVHLPVCIRRSPTIASLTQLLIPICLEALVQVLQDLPSHLRSAVSQSLLPLPPNPAPRLQPELGNIDWVNQSAFEIVRLWHAASNYIHLTTQLVLDVPTQEDLHTKASQAKFVRSCLRISINTPPLLIWPPVDDSQNSRAPPAINFAGSVLSKLSLSAAVKPGSIVYIESSGCNPTTDKNRHHPSLNLLPLMYVACRNSDSWLGLSSVVVGHPGGRRRPLDSTAFYTGYFSSRRMFKDMCRLVPGIWSVGSFSSLPNPLWPLPSPLTVDPRLNTDF
uniref:Methionyl-tRNA formyltransferase n=1 Tax=Schistocephalus solidus TaxID=70667 RepID=A0A0V0J858_SCHSO